MKRMLGGVSCAEIWAVRKTMAKADRNFEFSSFTLAGCWQLKE
jgi:hypothetical protein